MERDKTGQDGTRGNSADESRTRLEKRIVNAETQHHHLTRPPGRWDRPGRGAGSPRAFTLIEMMVTIAIIALLVSLVVVAGGRIRGLADEREARQALASVKTGIEQFKDNFGYYPPLLDDRPADDSFLSIVSDEDELEEVGYYSTLTLVPYLVGIGDINLDGVPDLDGRGEDDFDDGRDGPGFRDPGRDKSWGGAIDAEDRERYWRAYEQTSEDEELTGKVTRPLVELNDAIRPAVDRNGDPIEEHYLFQFTDPWERPIRYYRNWDREETDLEEDGLPVDWPREWFESSPEDERASLVQALRGTPYVLLSSGPDRLARPERFEDEQATAEHDLDNILEIGE